MILLGVTGPIGHGKSTFIEYLTAAEPNSATAESYKVIAEVADILNTWLAELAQPVAVSITTMQDIVRELPGAIKTVTGQTYAVPAVTSKLLLAHPADFEKLEQYLRDIHDQPQLLTQKITDSNKPAYRAFLQWLGGYGVNYVDKGIWYGEIVRRALTAQKKGTQLFAVGGVRFPSDGEILRANDGLVIEIVRPGLAQVSQDDPTEKNRSSVRTDSTIYNNSSLEDLQLLAVRVLEDIKNGALQLEYYASSHDDS